MWTAKCQNSLGPGRVEFYDPQTSGGLLLSVKREEAESLIEKMKALSLPCVAVGEANNKKRQVFNIQIK